MTIETYFPDWDVDLREGKEAEGLVRAIFQRDRVQTEVKLDRRAGSRSGRAGTDNYYIEYEQQPKGKGKYRASGIQTSTADYWALVAGKTRSVFVVPRALLDAYVPILRRNPRLLREEKDGDNPTRGVLVPSLWLASVMTHGLNDNQYPPITE